MELGGQRHTPAALPPWNIPGTHRTGWHDLRAGLDERRKLYPHRNSISGLSSP